MVWKERLAQHVFNMRSIAPLATFRVVFGALMLFSTVRFMVLGWIDDHYLEPVFHFKYFGFEWVEPAEASVMYGLHIALCLAALGVMLGLYYRVSAALVFLLFTYFELIDLTYYLNHYYFVSLVSLIMIFLPAHKRWSFDAWRKPKIVAYEVPAWTINLLKFQLGLVYLYAGLAKINSTWLIDHLPLRIWLPAADELPIIGPLLATEAAPMLFSWGGMLYDVSIPFLLLWSRTRVWAYIAVILFHAITGWLFQIGVFPLVMIGATLIFFSDAWHLRLWNKRIQPKPKEKNTGQLIVTSPRKQRLIGATLALYCAFQVLFPWRFVLYPGNMFWTEQGYRFGWRVMLMEKAGTATFYVQDQITGREGIVFNNEFLNPHQEKQMAMQPDMIIQYAHFLADHYEALGMRNVRIRAEVYVTLNGARSRLLFSDTLNLLSVEDTWAHKNWLFPHE
jgi:hypothetical protein